jgi:hypothetical protein
MESFGSADLIKAESDTFEFIYKAPNVDDGTMGAREVAEVLTGLTRAFSTIAQEREIEDRYELRIKDIEPGSVRLVFEAVAFAKANPAAASAIAAGATAIAAGASVVLNAVTNTVSGLYKVVTDIAKVIDAKRRTKGARLATMPASFTDGNVQLTVPDDLIVLTKGQYELLLSQRVDRQLSQIVSPLAPRRIDNFEMRRSDVELARVSAAEKDYFEYRELIEVESKEGTEIVGTLNSLTKTSLRGTFYTQDGVHVPYRYVGGDIQQLLRGFTARELLKVRGRIKFGSDGLPSYIEVQEIDFLQHNFFRQ